MTTKEWNEREEEKFIIHFVPLIFNIVFENENKNKIERRKEESKKETKKKMKYSACSATEIDKRMLGFTVRILMRRQNGYEQLARHF